MEPRPQSRYRTPRYPTRLEAEMDPRLLAALPPGWRTKPELVRMAGLFLSANLVAGGSAASAADRAPGKTPKSGSFAAVVAPLFEHGDGRGSVGCVVVAPPVFLSEEEAAQVITDELAAHGVVSREKHAQLPDVRISPRSRSQCRDKDADTKTYEAPNDATTLELAVWDSTRRVAASVIVDQNEDAMGALQNGSEPSGDGFRSCSSTVRGVDFKVPATYVREQVRRQGRSVYFGVFYDPVTTSKKTSRELLREQVKDFAEWLEGQGVI